MRYEVINKAGTALIVVYSWLTYYLTVDVSLLAGAQLSLHYSIICYGRQLRKK